MGGFGGLTAGAAVTWHSDYRAVDFPLLLLKDLLYDALKETTNYTHPAAPSHPSTAPLLTPLFTVVSFFFRGGDQCLITSCYPAGSKLSD